MAVSALHSTTHSKPISAAIAGVEIGIEDMSQELSPSYICFSPPQEFLDLNMESSLLQQFCVLINELLPPIPAPPPNRRLNFQPPDMDSSFQGENDSERKRTILHRLAKLDKSVFTNLCEKINQRANTPYFFYKMLLLASYYQIYSNRPDKLGTFTERLVSEAERFMKLKQFHIASILLSEIPPEKSSLKEGEIRYMAYRIGEFLNNPTLKFTMSPTFLQISWQEFAKKTSEELPSHLEVQKWAIIELMRRCSKRFSSSEER